MWELAEFQIGDAVCGSEVDSPVHYFDPPTIEAVVVRRRTTDNASLYLALAQLAEQDPLINLRQDDARQETFISLYGEVQKEMMQAALSGDFGIDVEFRETAPICVERV